MKWAKTYLVDFDMNSTLQVQMQKAGEGAEVGPDEAESHVLASSHDTFFFLRCRS